MNTVTLDAAALSSLRSALKHSGTSSDGLVKLLRQLLVSSYFEACGQMISTKLDNTIRTRFSLIVPQLVGYSNDYYFFLSIAPGP